MEFIIHSSTDRFIDDRIKLKFKTIQDLKEYHNYLKQEFGYRYSGLYIDFDTKEIEVDLR